MHSLRTPLRTLYRPHNRRILCRERRPDLTMATATLSTLTDTLLSGAPLRLHTREPEKPNGAPKLAPRMLRHAEAALAYAEAVEDGQGAWWQSAEVRKYVQAKMLTKRHGGEAYVLLAYVAADKLTWEQAVVQYGGREISLLHMRDLLAKYARDAKTPKARRWFR